MATRGFAPTAPTPRTWARSGGCHRLRAPRQTPPQAPMKARMKVPTSGATACCNRVKYPKKPCARSKRGRPPPGLRSNSRLQGLTRPGQSSNRRRSWCCRANARACCRCSKRCARSTSRRRSAKKPRSSIAARCKTSSRCWMCWCRHNMICRWRGHCARRFLARLMRRWCNWPWRSAGSPSPGIRCCKTMRWRRWTSCARLRRKACKARPRN